MLKRFEGKYLAEIELEDAATFNKTAGLPAAAVLTLQLLQTQAIASPSDFTKNDMLNEFFSYLRALPEGLIPVFFAEQVNSREKSLRECIIQLPIENFCALRAVAYFVHSICFSRGEVDFFQFERSVGLLDCLTQISIREHFRFSLHDMFYFPAKYFN